MTPTTPDTQGPPRPDLDVGLKYWNAVAHKDVSNNAVPGGLFSFYPSLSVFAFSAVLDLCLFFYLGFGFGVSCCLSL